MKKWVAVPVPGATRGAIVPLWELAADGGTRGTCIAHVMAEHAELAAESPNMLEMLREMEQGYVDPVRLRAFLMRFEKVGT